MLCSIDRTLHSSPLGWCSAPKPLDALCASLHELHGVFDAIVKPPWREQQQRLMRPAIKRAAASSHPSTATNQRLLSTLSSQRSSDQHRSTAWLKRQQQSHSTHLLTDIRADRQGTDEPSASHRCNISSFLDGLLTFPRFTYLNGLRSVVTASIAGSLLAAGGFWAVEDLLPNGAEAGMIFRTNSYTGTTRWN